MATQPRSHNVPAGTVGRQARALAVQSLYSHDIRGVADNDIIEWLCADEPIPGSVRRNAVSLVDGILENAGHLDEIIREYAPAIPVNLLAIVDRNILRVAIYELTFRKQVPGRVIINEATELASAFGSESSGRFVNGVLGSIYNRLPDAANSSDSPNQSHD